MSNPAQSAAIYAKAADGQNYPVGGTTPAAATGTLTLAGNAVNGETFTIGVSGGPGTAIYTWKTTLGSAAYQVLIGATANASCANAIAAINKSAGDGSLYTSSTPANLLVTAAAGAGDTVVVTSIIPGIEGNSIGTTEAMTNGSWGAVTLTGGTPLALNVTVAGGGEAVTIANGADVAEGATTDAPVADNTTVASATAASGIGLWKRLVNLGIAILAKTPALGTQAALSTDVLTTLNPRFSVFTNIGANVTLNVKASAGNVFAVCCNNANAATRYLQLHNTATTPAGAAVPVYSFPVFSGGSTILGTDFFGTAGVNLSTGIAFAFSTTRDTYTAGSAGDQSTVVHYL